MSSHADGPSTGDRTSSSGEPPLGGLLGIPVAVAGEVMAAVPRLMGRTRRQVDLARRVAGHLPCAGFLAPPPRDVQVPAHEVAPIDVLTVIAEPDPIASAEAAAGPTPGTIDPETASGAVAPTSTTPAAPVPPAGELAVPDYDALSASQVVPRLASLSPEELEAVRAYERAHRNRQTILGRVSQLLEG